MGGDSGSRGPPVGQLHPTGSNTVLWAGSVLTTDEPFPSAQVVVPRGGPQEPYVTVTGAGGASLGTATRGGRCNAGAWGSCDVTCSRGCQPPSCRCRRVGERDSELSLVLQSTCSQPVCKLLPVTRVNETHRTV